MEKEEIKRETSMRDVLDRYGLRPNRAGFISCPFHQEKTASCKIYKESFHCFGCGANGDIFSFVQRMEGCSFKEAFISLGGSYEKPESLLDARIRRRKHLIARQNIQRKEERKNALRREEIRQAEIMRSCRDFTEGEPFSDEWCARVDKYCQAMGKLDMLEQEERTLT